MTDTLQAAVLTTLRAAPPGHDRLEYGIDTEGRAHLSCRCGATLILASERLLNEATTQADIDHWYANHPGLNDTLEASRPAPELPSMAVLADADELRTFLDDLNEAGQHPVAVGHDATQPFLITLVGAYADSEAVFFDSPWQQDMDLGQTVDGAWVPKQPRCTDCRGVEWALEDLRFPVVVLVPEGQSWKGGHHPACVQFGDDAQCSRCNA